MKTIGLIGGTSWTSTIEYYRYINEETARRLGGLHSAKLILASIDFAELEAAMHADQWDEVASILKHAAGQLYAAGVDGILLCSNLIHKLFDEVQACVPVPLQHIGDALAAEIVARKFKTAALLGTKATMAETFYRARIEEKSGAGILIPSPEEMDYINTAIFERMCRNNYMDEDRLRIAEIIEGLKKRGAECVLLSCTELPVLLAEAALPLLNSTRLHSLHAVAWALADGAGRA
jgi:aspartate racemase